MGAGRGREVSESAPPNLNVEQLLRRVRCRGGRGARLNRPAAAPQSNSGVPPALASGTHASRGERRGRISRPGHGHGPRCARGTISPRRTRGAKGVGGASGVAGGRGGAPAPLGRGRRGGPWLAVRDNGGRCVAPRRRTVVGVHGTEPSTTARCDPWVVRRPMSRPGRRRDAESPEGGSSFGVNYSQNLVRLARGSTSRWS